MNKLGKVLVSAGLLVLCSSVHSEDTTVQKQDTAKVELGIPVECMQIFGFGYEVAELVVDSKGNIYVNGGHPVFELNKIKIFNPMGEKEGEFVLYDSLLLPPHDFIYNPSPIGGIDIDLDDNIYLCNVAHKTVEKFTTAGDFLKKIVLPPSPRGDWYGMRDVVVDEEGTIYVAAYLKFVYIFDKDGKLLRKWAKSEKEDNQYCGLSALAIDKRRGAKMKRIYLGDGRACRVYVFSKKEKRFLFSFGNRGSSPGEMLSISSMEVDSEGYIYVLDRNMGYCSVFSPEGKFVFRFGHEEGGQKFFYFPNGMFIDQNDKIYISNSEKGCILVYEWKQDRKKF